jgi:hypothetical protein
MGTPSTRHLRLWTLVLGLLALSTPVWCDVLGEQVIQRFRAADPQVDVIVTGPNDLQLKKAGKEMQVYLDNVRRICDQRPDECRQQTDLLVQMSLRMLSTEGGRAAEASRLRVVIRSKAYVDGLTQTLSKGPGAARSLVVRPLSDDLVIMLVVDMPESVSPLMDDELGKMNLSVANAWDRATSNSEQALGGIKLNELDTHVFGLGGDFFAPAWLLSSHWEAFARDKRINIAWACVYDADEAIFVFDDPVRQDKVQRACSRFAQRARKPVSDRLMVWKKEQPRWSSVDR